MNDTNGLAWFPANDYDLSGEYARADFDRRHQLVLLGRVATIKTIDLGVGLTMNSAGPYTEYLAGDIYNNGRGGARPSGVARNTLSGAGFAQLDVRASRSVPVGAKQKRRAVAVALDAFNVLNRTNDQTFVGTLGSPFFGQPISARPPRQLQFSLTCTF